MTETDFKEKLEKLGEIFPGQQVAMLHADGHFVVVSGPLKDPVALIMSYCLSLLAASLSLTLMDCPIQARPEVQIMSREPERKM